MKPEFLQIGGERPSLSNPSRVQSESDRLTEVLLCTPAHLRPVPCCSVTRESLNEGFETDTSLALDQHRQLRDTLARLGVHCHVMNPAADLPDLCYTRDCAVTTPWGVALLNPAMPHRQRELRHVEAQLASLGVLPAIRMTEGTIEGGDVCVVRDGLAIVGCSGQRTSLAGAEALAALFRTRGWDVLLCPFDAYHLHLDTIFCMLDAHTALACIEALPPSFIASIEARGIRLLPVEHAEARRLGCNVVSIDGHNILIAAGQERIRGLLEQSGFGPIAVDVSQFAACGGGLHCLTMPLARAAA